MAGRHRGQRDTLAGPSVHIPNPAFVAANFLRDVQHAALIHGIDPGGDLRGFMRNIPPSMATITRTCAVNPHR